MHFLGNLSPKSPLPVSSPTTPSNLCEVSLGPKGLLWHHDVCRCLTYKLLQTCGVRPKFVENGFEHPYCGKTCAAAANNGPSSYVAPNNNFSRRNPQVPQSVSTASQNQYVQNQGNYQRVPRWVFTECTLGISLILIKLPDTTTRILSRTSRRPARIVVCLFKAANCHAPIVKPRTGANLSTNHLRCVS